MEKLKIGLLDAYSGGGNPIVGAAAIGGPMGKGGGFVTAGGCP